MKITATNAYFNFGYIKFLLLSSSSSKTFSREMSSERVDCSMDSS